MQENNIHTNDADRAWLLIPCDTNAKSWTVPMERTKPGYEGVHALGEEITMLPREAEAFRRMENPNEVVTYDYTQNPKETSKRYEKAQDMSHVGNCEYDPVSANFWASDEAKRIYGYDLSMDDFSTETVENCIVEREQVHQALIDLLEHNKEYDLVFDIVSHDKGIRETIRCMLS